MPSQAYLSAINARVNPDPLITLAHIHHPQLSLAEFPDGLRFHDSGTVATDILSIGGLQYIPWAFRVPWPDVVAGEQPVIEGEIDNVDARIMRAIMGLQSAPTLTLWSVMKSTPTITEHGPLKFYVTRVRADRFTIRADLVWATNLLMGYPRWRFSPDLAPGVFS